MSNKNNITVLKIPNEKSSVHRSQTFPRMPRLYLELLENKSKIKQDLINTEYLHDYEKSPVPGLEPLSPTSMSSSSDGSVSSKQTSDMSVDSAPDNSVIIDDDEDENTSVVSDISDNSADSEQQTDKVTNDDDSVDVKKRLGKLLQDDDDSTVTSKRSKYSKKRDKRGKVLPEAPSLNELEKNGSYVPKQHLRDVNNEKVDDDMKRELLFKFQLLKKTYPKASLPEFTIHTDYQIMLNNYEDCVRRLSLDSSVENYKQYLIYGFMGCEFLLGKFFKLDMEGFTQQQILSMSSYEKLLIELGEKSYIPEGSRWPVELRLLFLVIMNGLF